jgi:hypothetical protein
MSIRVLPRVPAGVIDAKGLTSRIHLLTDSSDVHSNQSNRRLEMGA